MTINTTRWSPDTCTCIFEYTWDDAVPQLSRSHTLTNVPSKCTAHSAQSDSTCYSTVLAENPLKGGALLLVLTNGPSTIYDTDGTARILKPSIKYNFSWSGVAPNRVLNISFTGITLTTTQKSTIQTALNTKFGSGRVILA